MDIIREFANVRITHAEHEGLTAILGPQLLVVEWPRVPVDLQEEKRQANRMASWAMGLEMTRTLRESNVTAVIRRIQALPIPASIVGCIERGQTVTGRTILTEGSKCSSEYLLCRPHWGDGMCLRGVHQELQ